MPSFPFRTDAQSEAFCLLIAREMSGAFGIAESEAQRRISKYWAHIPAILENDVIFHEDENYWARTIYYGKDSAWWLPETERSRLRLPPLRPLPLD